MDITEAMKMKKRTEIDVLVLLKKQVKGVRLEYDNSFEMGKSMPELTACRVDAELPEG
jgi:hypothetical protein